MDKNLRCDILVISGHFGGSFFGTQGRISLEDFEKKSCQSSLFHRAKEVFLFGCNTLAGKTQDHRTPEEYIRVLIADNFSQAEAELIAAFRYSPVGVTFHDRMSNVFSGVPRVYGFSSVGPSGANVEGMLDDYFFKKKNYASYIDSLKPSANEELLQSLKWTAIVQTQGAKVSASEVSPRCVFEDPKNGDSKKLRLAQELLMDPKRRFEHLGAVSSYLLRGGRTGGSRQQEVQMMRELYKDQGLKQEMHKIIDQGLKGYPTVRLEMISIGKYLGWLSLEDQNKIAQEVVGDLYKDGLTQEELDQVASIGSLAGLYLTWGMVKDFIRDQNVLKSFVYVKPQDPEIHWALVEGMKNDTDPDVRRSAARALSHINPQDPKIQQELARLRPAN